MLRSPAADPAYCDHVYCLTLSQLAGNIGRYVNSSNTTLYIGEGTHILHESFSVSNVTKFSMTANDSSSDSVNITCNEGANFNLSHISRLHIQGLVFVSCGGNRVEAVDVMTINNSKFLGNNTNGSSLTIVGVNGRIMKTAFLSNTIGTYRKNVELFTYLEKFFA